MDDARTLTREERSRRGAGPAQAPEAAEPPGDSQCRLEALSGPMDGRVFHIAATPATLGRGEGCAVVLPLDGTISRQHARIVLEQGRYWLEDLGSRCGTFVGSSRTFAKTPLDNGTIFALGDTEIEFTCKPPSH